MAEPSKTLHTTPDISLTDGDRKKVSDAKAVDAAVVDSEKSPVEVGTAELDIFSPFPELEALGMEAEPESVLTFRAVLVGCLLGTLVNASNLYLGLRSGWSFGANMFGTLFGFAILKSLSRALPAAFPIFGGYFGPKENSIVQTAAVTSGGLSFIFISGVPALYQMKLMSGRPFDDYWKLVSFTFICAYYGLMFAIPMRNYFLKYVARELNLIFPTFTAVAITIRTLHENGQGLINARRKVKALGLVFIVCLVHRTVSQYAPGILWDWHVFTWIFIWSNYSNATALAGQSWQWYIELTPAFFGTGMLVGLNVGFSALLGSLLAWGIIGPALVASGAAAGVTPYVGTKWSPLTIFMTMDPGIEPGTLPSPRYWILWPGIMIMLLSTIAEVAIQYKVLYRAVKTLIELVRRSRQAAAAEAAEPGQPRRDFFARVFKPTSSSDSSEASWWMWLPGTVVLVIVSCVVLGLQYQMPIGASILSLFFGFFFAFMSIQVYGSTEIAPTSAITKVVQLILGGISNQANSAAQVAYTVNIAGAQVAGGAAYAAMELMADLRVGYLLGTPLYQQLAAQILGNVVAVFLSPLLFVLFSTAYPCILESGAAQCSFQVPAAAGWTGLASVATTSSFPVPKSAAISALVLGLFSAAVVLFRGFYLVGEREKYRVWVPNMSVIGLTMVIPSTCYSIALAAGAVVGYLWQKKSPRTHEFYAYSVAAGAIAGEGIGGVFNAIFQIAGIIGSVYGTQVACPLDQCA
ncbi:hypothetical protein ACHAPT_009482 [Fusarium lateritium]